MKLKILQLNLHKSKLASAELLLTLEEESVDVALVQEPWIASGNKIAGLGSSNYSIFYPTTVSRARTAILVRKGIYAYLISNYSTDDITVIALEGCRDEPLLMASCYLAQDRESPTEETERLIQEVSQKRQPLVIGADVNAHHTLWGCKDVNNRGESLLDFILKYNLKIANRGEEPTYVGPTSSSVIDLTLASGTNTEVTEWRVLSKPSFSDHRYIQFKVTRTLPEPPPIVSTADTEKCVETLCHHLTSAFNTACKTSIVRRKHRPPWWNPQLKAQRTDLQEIFKLAKQADEDLVWDEYKIRLRDFKKKVQTAKRNSWRSFCSGIEKVTETARLRKLLSSQPAIQSQLRTSDGQWTSSSREATNALLSEHFPGCTDVLDPQQPMHTNPRSDVPGNIITPHKIQWAIDSFES